MSIRGQISGTFKSLVDMFDSTKKDRTPHNYPEACFIARKLAQREVSPLRIDLIKERMSLPLFEAYGKKMEEKEREIDNIEQQRFDDYLDNIVKLYGIEIKK
jgi:hypothetical protein